MFELAARVEGIVPPLTKAGTPVSAWAKAITKIAEDLRGSDPAAVVGRGLFQKATSSEPSEFGRHEVPPGVRTIMTQVSVQLRALVARDLVTRAEALGRLADHYGVALDQRILQSGSLRFEDVPRLLSGPRPTGARADLRYRMDSAVEHVLLDEFQDTSLEQWAALQPVMDAIIQDGEDTHGTAVVVADPKQSIYGWRGAAPVLVHAVGGRYALEPDRLPVSWRSSQVVLDTVNQVFEDLPVSAVLDHEKGDDLTAAAWVEDFQPHRAAEPRLGHVRLLAGPEGSRGDSPELTTFVVDRIGELHQEAPGHSIGVLTRTNQMVAGIIDGLRRRGIPASEEGGTGLMDSAGVASVVALLRVADHPGDRLSRYHVARTPIGAVMRLGDPDDPVAARAVALRLRRGLMELGYGSVLAALVDGLAGHCTTRELRRLHQLVGLGYRYDGSRRTDRIADFVRTVESERVEAPEAGGVRVMTIHGSKGLEFDAVVLPELHAPWFRGGNDGPVGYRPTGIGPITHAFPYIAENERRLFADCPELIGAHAQARAGGLRDALGALYVGMTRARHSLLMIVPSGGGSGQSAARLLRERLVVTDPDAPEIGGSVLFETGDPTWAVTPAEGREETDQHPPAGADGPIRIRLRSDDPPRRNLPRSRPSGLEGSDAPSIETLLRAPSRWQGRDRGTLVHRWLESMAWIEDWSPDMVGFRAVARIVAPRLPTDGVENAWSALNEQLEAPQIRAHLSRENHPPGSRVERELPFLLEIDEALMEGIIDRVVLVEENGVAVRAEISDYKTDKVGGPDEIGEKVAFYAPQLEAYRRAVSLLFGIRTDHVDAYIVFLDAATVVPVPSSAIIPPTEEPVG